MATKTITSANAVLTLWIPSLIPNPVQIQGFSADNIFDVEAISAGEFVMGVDGILSMGFVYEMVPMNIKLQANSNSGAFFDTWRANEVAAGDKYTAQGRVSLPGLGQAWTLNNGGLKTYQPIPAAGKMLDPRTFGLVWQQVTPVPV